MAARSSLSLAVLALLVSGECRTAFDSDSDGKVRVAIATSGANLDLDGYSLTVDGDMAYVVATQGTITLQLTQGTHTVQLNGLAANCTVNGDNPRTIVVGASGSAQVLFGVTCARSGRLGGEVAPA